MKCSSSGLKIWGAPNQKGAALITGLLLVLVLTILSMAAMMSTASELKMASNDRSAKRTFYSAEAGLEDARSRLQSGASASPIYDSQLSNPSWTAFIGTEVKSGEKGFQSTNSSHIRYEPLNANLSYVVTISHKLNPSGSILKWGDANNDGLPEENTVTGRNILVITSEGYEADGASKPLRIEAVQVPPITSPAALYTKADTTIQGTSTHVLGMDHCGTSHVPGIMTREGVQENGKPTITGWPSAIVERSATNIDVQEQVNQYKRRPNYQYSVNSAILTGMDWGSPVAVATQQSPSNCNSRNIVYFNTNGTYVTLSGESHGCGILLVEGDLHVHGGFQWYGAILVTGSIVFTGGGGKNVTGTILSGGTVSADLVGGDAAIVYCSRAVSEQSDSLPLITLRWVELFS
ncbi:MAG: PilX N-terminal domain-containing pilus assembly protein [Gemmatimonadota bacterium]